MGDIHLAVEYVPIDSIKPYERNAKLHPPEQIAQIKRSIEVFGFRDPIGVWHDEIVEGHGRHIAAKELGFTEVPVIRLDTMTDEERRAYALAHNKLTMNSDFDFGVLDTELDGIIDIDMSEFGFDLDLDEPEEAQEDEFEPDVPAEPKAKLGDIWKLGRHRLMCGDSTDVATIDRLMDGTIADIAVTSPPYNADHMDVNLSKERGGGTQKATQKKYLADDDKRTESEYMDFLSKNIDILIDHADEVFYNIGVGAGSKKTIANILYKYCDVFKELMYWEKDNPMPVITESVISSAVELIICFGRNNSRSFNHFSDRMFHGVIKGHSAALSNQYADIHKATFPVYLPAEIITRFTENDGTVLDCFGGTGTTLIACEQLNRTCYMCELDPRYVDVIIDRWQTLTGETAVLLNG